MDGTRDIDLDPSEVEFGSSGRSLVPAALRGKVWLALAGLVIALLAGQLWREHRQSGPEREAALAIEAYTAAWNAHDSDGVRAVLAPGATFAEAESLEHPLLTATGGQIDAVLDAMFDAGVSLETTGRVIVVGDGAARATVPQRFGYQVNGLNVSEDGVSLFSLVRVGGGTRIAEHVWWRPQGPQYPSMRWVVDSSTP
ncbi:MAG TPA: nuclear transport factor 2 family protein [Micromonosporaceae bacterium]|jgi:hypothetical protein